MPAAKKSKPKSRTKARAKKDPTPLEVIQHRYAELKARYDAAQTDDDNRKHWLGADGLSATDANSAAIRATLRARSRYERDNNGYYSGIVRTRADDLVGTGPKLQVLTENDDLASSIETRFAAWARAVRLAEKLHTLDQARMVDGEAFALLATNEAVADAVKLDLVTVEADRVADPRWRFTESPGDGIEYDSFGNPVSYKVLRYHPNSAYSWAAATPEYDTYRAEFVCHWYRCDRPGQLRGVPELTASLPLFPVARRWTLATLFAAESAANFAVLLETAADANSETDDPIPFETLEMVRNLMTALPRGVTAKQMAAEHPNSEYQNFKWEVLAECARPIRMPVNVAAGDTSRSNFSSAKIDHLGYRHGLRVDRSRGESSVLDRIYPIWFAEALTVPDYLPAEARTLPLSHQWTWPGWLSWDKNEAAQDTEMLSNNTTTLAELLSEAGQDWRDVLRQRAKELELMEELGITPEPAPPGPPGPPNNAAPTTDEEVDEEEAETSPDAAEARALPSRIRGHLNGNGRGHK